MSSNDIKQQQMQMDRCNKLPTIICFTNFSFVFSDKLPRLESAWSPTNLTNTILGIIVTKNIAAYVYEFASISIILSCEFWRLLIALLLNELDRKPSATASIRVINIAQNFIFRELIMINNDKLSDAFFLSDYNDKSHACKKSCGLIHLPKFWPILVKFDSNKSVRIE